jgi:hypothetical protein
MGYRRKQRNRKAGYAKLRRLEKHDSPFHEPFVTLSSELLTIRELNKRLGKSIAQIQKADMVELHRKAAKLNDKDQKVIEEFIRVIADVMTKKVIKQRPKNLNSPRAAKFIWSTVLAVSLPAKFSDFIRNTSLTYLVSIFENFLEQIVDVALRERPEAIIGVEKTVLVDDLIACTDIEAVRQRLRAKATESVLQGDIQDICKRLEQKWKVSMSHFVGWDAFKERFYRRNVIIHHSGVVDEIYRRKTGYRGKVKKLSVSEKYLVKSLDLFEDMAVNLAAAFNDKFLASD